MTATYSVQSLIDGLTSNLNPAWIVLAALIGAVLAFGIALYLVKRFTGL